MVEASWGVPSLRQPCGRKYYERDSIVVLKYHVPDGGMVTLLGFRDVKERSPGVLGAGGITNIPL